MNDSAPANKSQTTASWIRYEIAIISMALIFIFSWLDFKNLDWVDIANQITSELLLRVVLILNFAAWCFGTVWDTKMHLKCYHGGVDIARFPARVAMYLTGVFFGICCLYQSFDQLYPKLNEFQFFQEICQIPFLSWIQNLNRSKWIVSSLILFHVWNIISWRILLRLIRKPVADSGKFFQEEGSKLREVQLKWFVFYISGYWQWFRFFAASFFLGAAWWAAFMWDIGDGFFILTFTKDHLIGALLLFYVLVMELWIWFERAKLWGITFVIKDFMD